MKNQQNNQGGVHPPKEVISKVMAQHGGANGKYDDQRWKM
jgi:hypothetical protein